MKKIALKGFTIIELLIVIVIIGILSGIGISSFNSYIDKARVAKAITFSTQLQKRIDESSVLGETTAPQYNFKNVSRYTPFVKSKNNLYDFTRTGLYFSSSGTLESSTDHPLNSGYSLKSYSSPIINNQPPSETDSLTISSWIKLEEWPNVLTYPITIHGHRNLRAIISKNNQSISFRITIGGNGFSISSPNNLIKLNRWHHVFLQANQSSLKLWLDGNLVAQKSISANGTMSYGIIGLGHVAFSGLIADPIITDTNIDPSFLNEISNQ